MKNVIKWAAIAAGTLLVILIIGIIALPFVFPLEKIKDFAAAKISETIHREVGIEKASFDLFSGIKLNGLYVGNREGYAKKSFIAADSIELRYAFWPLFSRKIIIKEIRLVKPEILIEKNVRGEFNFSDMLQPKTTGNRDVQSQVSGNAKPPFDLFVAAFSIKNGRITYLDRAAGTSNEIRNFNVGISGFELALVKPIDFKVSADVTYQKKVVPIALSGKVGVSLVRESINIPDLSLSIAGETISAAGIISNWKTGPNVFLSIKSKSINIDPLLAIFAGGPRVEKAKPKPGELTRTINKALSAVPNKLHVEAKLNVENLSFQKFKIDKIAASLLLAGKMTRVNIQEVKIYGGSLVGNLIADLNVSGLAYEVKDLRLADFNAAPFTNAVAETFLTGLPDHKGLINKVYGTLNVSTSLRGRGVEPQDIMANLMLDGSLALKNGELKRLKTLAEVGKTLKSNSLQEDIKFGGLYTAFSFKNRVVTARALKIDENDFKLYFNGGADLKTLKWVPGNRLTLKLSPNLTRDLPKELTIFRDKNGWLEMTFEITGDLKLPIPKPILDKPVEAVVGKIKAKIEAKKVEIVEKAKVEIATKEAEVKKAIEEEAKKKLKELIKF